MESIAGNSVTETQVLIVVAGPVGLTLALDLGQRRRVLHADRTERNFDSAAENGTLQRPPLLSLP